MAFSLSTAGAVLLNEAQKSIAEVVPHITTTQVQQLILGTSNHFLQSLPEDQHAAALQALILSLRKVYAASTPWHEPHLRHPGSSPALSPRRSVLWPLCL
jgi:hypothetical protein